LCPPKESLSLKGLSIFCLAYSSNSLKREFLEAFATASDIFLFYYLIYFPFLSYFDYEIGSRFVVDLFSMCLPTDYFLN